MFFLRHFLLLSVKQDVPSAGLPLRANVPPQNQFPAPVGFPGPSSSMSQTAGLNRFDSPGQVSLAGQPGPASAQLPRQAPPFRAGGGLMLTDAGPAGVNPANQLNDLNQPQVYYIIVRNLYSFAVSY